MYLKQTVEVNDSLSQTGHLPISKMSFVSTDYQMRS